MKLTATQSVVLELLARRRLGFTTYDAWGQGTEWMPMKNASRQAAEKALAKRGLVDIGLDSCGRVSWSRITDAGLRLQLGH
jgi:hypothetical protein